MAQTLSKKAIRQKTIQMGSLTLASRGFGLVREILLARYLGNGILSDAFWTAFKVPNMLRKIFAEGALSAAFIPTIVQIVRSQEKDEANSLMSLAFLIFEGFVLLICLLFMIAARPLIYFMAPGFSAEQINQTVPMLIILMPFIFFISGGALLAGSLQAQNHFFVPAIAPIFLNFVFILGASLGIMYNLPVTYLCLMIILGGIIQFLAHLLIYYRLSFSFGTITKKAFSAFAKVFAKFLVCIPSMSLAEVSLFIDTQFASYVIGGISSITYANRFMGIPLGVFATSFATILLPHFSRISSYAPRRFSFYLLESSKLIFWVTTPIMLGMIFFSRAIFVTLFLSNNFPMDQVIRTSNVLIISLLGLFFFSLNKIILNIFYASHKTFIPTMIALACTLANITLNFTLMPYFEIAGLAISTTAAAIIQTILSLYFLRKTLHLSLFPAKFFTFLYYYFVQLGCIGSLFLGLYYLIKIICISLLTPTLVTFLLEGTGLWLWVIPLCVVAFTTLFYTKKLFKVSLYFLD